jgi:molybdate transport system substrate-binding protein
VLFGQCAALRNTRRNPESRYNSYTMHKPRHRSKWPLPGWQFCRPIIERLSNWRRVTRRARVARGGGGRIQALFLPPIWVFLLGAAFGLAACAPRAEIPAASPTTAGQPVTLTVMAAASLTGTFEELGAQFEAQHPGVRVQFSFGASQQLAQQLGQGASADVFASANTRQMEAVVAEGRVEKEAVRVFARNRLVVVVPLDNPAGLAGLEDLAQEDLKIVLAAQEVPVGQYSQDFLEKAGASGTFGEGYAEKVRANVVSYEETVRAVLAKVILGEADAGMVYVSDVTGSDAEKVRQIEIPGGLNITADYPIAVVQDSGQRELAQQFVALVLSADGQAVLARRGFLPAGE